LVETVVVLLAAPTLSRSLCTGWVEDHPASNPSLYRLSYPDASSGAVADSENVFLLFLYNSRITPMAYSGFYDFHPSTHCMVHSVLVFLPAYAK
jgi:hypothetical protein